MVGVKIEYFNPSEKENHINCDEIIVGNILMPNYWALAKKRKKKLFRWVYGTIALTCKDVCSL